MSSSTPALLTVAEAAEHVRRTPETVREWIRAGRLPAVRPAGAGKYLIDPTDLDQLLGRSTP